MGRITKPYPITAQSRWAPWRTFFRTSPDITMSVWKICYRDWICSAIQDDDGAPAGIRESNDPGRKAEADVPLQPAAHPVPSVADRRSHQNPTRSRHSCVEWL